MERRHAVQCPSTIPSQIESLFERNPLLCWFSIVGKDDVPDHIPRSGDEEQLFVGELGVPPGVGVDHFKKIFRDVISAVTDLVGEQPELIESLRGRTFARTLQ